MRLQTRAAWLGYALVFILLSMQKNLLDFGARDSTLLLVMNSIVPIALIYSIYGYAFDKAFMERMIWRFMFWILSLRFVIVVLIGLSEYRQLYEYINAQGQSMEVTGINDAYYMLMLLIPLPALYALYRYSEAENPIWVEREHLEHAKYAEQLFEGKDSVSGSITRDEGEGVSCSAVLSRDNGVYVLQLSISEAGKTRDEQHRFDSAILALEYIEENTPLSMYELG